MTRAQVQNVIVAQFATVLSGYDGLRVTKSLEDALQIYDVSGKWVLVTPHKHDHDTPIPGADNWQFLVQMSMSLQPGAQATTTAAVEADEQLVVDAVNGINSREGYVALRSAGVCRAVIAGMDEDQTSESTINPHIISCATFN